MLGQVATLMDSLHLTCSEVLDGIPYRNLLLMQRDKAHVVYGAIVRKVSARDRLAAKGGARGKKGTDA